MGSGFFFTYIIQPLYNGLVLLIGLFPGAGAGIIVVLFTFLVKLALFPLSKKSIQTQVHMKRSEGELNKVKDKYKDNKQEQAKQIMLFYKEKGINPFSGILLIFLQIPIIFSLYYVFLKSGLPAINANDLYSFVADPTLLHPIKMDFLGLISDISSKSYVLAFLAAVSQYFQIRFSIPAIKPKTSQDSFKDDLARSMSMQMKYIFPVMVFFIAYKLSGTVALYWITSNLFAIGQEIFVRKRLLKQLASTDARDNTKDVKWKQV
jgi:YidC/Oxa1 family membrane protein insertase